ncbi:lytic transglycosylase domain-containing protein [Pontibacterium granulatum]|uniref:lytic transglycosylase domain-containing protein n=1 Tax=Pontibacterium granulatum TaxID=2036029 RepID=UPI00249A9770|nr:lytic transglycosylase domain-containing protein [Pontibacterium granulatum]MDI3326690.1 lytic transglycosylase domain-containing protein [Pontibacterium granulatum]
MNILKIFTLVGLLFANSVWANSAEQFDPALRDALKRSFATADSFEDRYVAEVWLVDMGGRIRNYVKDDLERVEILRYAHAEAQRHELPIDLVLGLIHTESLFNRFAISGAGAQGLMQVMPFWKNEIGRPNDNLTNIKTNLRYGCTILKHYLKVAKGDWTEALARYNGSYGKTWYPERVYKNQTRYRE